MFLVLLLEMISLDKACFLFLCFLRKGVLHCCCFCDFLSCSVGENNPRFKREEQDQKLRACHSIISLFDDFDTCKDIALLKTLAYVWSSLS